uniref:Fibronectin type-III domain-containing protein n=1 Tax=Hippocampus comes TaxID=109280 RepID=A0A3Q2Z1T7_HIPCM
RHSSYRHRCLLLHSVNKIRHEEGLRGLRHHKSLIPTDITKNSVSLAWTKPKHDGGSRLTGYVLEAQKRGTDQWAHVTSLKNMDFTVKNLNENEEYTFRVMAVNHSGRSAPRESKPIIVKDSTSLPEFDLRGVCQSTVIAKAGDNIRVEIPVMGRPRPAVTWQKDGNSLRLDLRNTETHALVDVTKLDSGHYELVLKNPGGTKIFPITVKVLDKPGKPTGPLKVTGIMADRCTLAWSEPSLDGGANITRYILEKRETSSLSWTVAAMLQTSPAS